MKTKIFTILMALMLLPSMATALDWTKANSDINSFNEHQWNNVATCNAQLKVDDSVVSDDTSAARYIVLAYMSGTLRGYQATPTTHRPATGGPAMYIYQTPVWADATTETGDAITFYIVDKTTQKVFQASHTHKWAEGTLEMPSSSTIIEISTATPVTSIDIKNNNATVFAKPISDYPVVGSNFAGMYSWYVDLSPYYQVSPDDATNKDVYVNAVGTNYSAAYESSTAFLFVNAAGQCQVNITSQENSGISGVLTLNVKIPVTDITAYEMPTVYRQDLIANPYVLDNSFDISPAEASDKSVTYTIDETQSGPKARGVLSVNAKGQTVFTPASDCKGIVYIKIASVSNPTVFDYFRIQVEVKADDIQINSQPTTVNVGDVIDLTPYYTVLPADIDYNYVDITSSDPVVATVSYSNSDDKWTLKALGTGTTTLTIKHDDGINTPITKMITITVVQPVTGITLNSNMGTTIWRKQAIEYPVNLSDYYEINPWTATNQSVTMTFVDGYSTKGTLAFNGKIWTFKPADNAKGEVKIKIASDENPAISTVLTLNIKVAVESITIDSTLPTTILQGSTTDLAPYYTVLPADADNKDVTISLGVATAPIAEIVDGTKLHALTAGTQTVYIECNENGAISTSITFIIKAICSDITLRVVPDANYDGADGSLRHPVLADPRRINVVVSPSDCVFDESKLAVSVTTDRTLPSGWVAGKTTNTGLAYDFTPYVPGNITVTFTYTGVTPAITRSVDIPAYVYSTVESGWNWLSSVVPDTYATIQSEIGSDLVEARTQSLYLVNDPYWGYFGGEKGSNDIPLKSTVDNGHFRVKTSSTFSKTLMFDGNAPLAAGKWSIVKGWNWVNNPIYYAVAISDLNGLAGFNEDDVIKSKDGHTATYKNGAWTGSLTYLTPGKAYSLKSNANAATTINFSGISFKQQSVSSLPSHAPRRVMWTYDGSQFMTNMSMIAEVPDLDNPEHYTIGTFVGDECRGEGEFIDGRWYIFAHGEADEVVTLKIANTFTNQVVDLYGEYKFAELMGSYDAPVMLYGANVTGIDDIEAAADIWVDGQTICGDDVEIYDINGRNMTAANGYLQPGLYIVKAKGKSLKVTVK